jgi:hypothetical protein
MIKYLNHQDIDNLYQMSKRKTAKVSKSKIDNNKNFNLTDPNENKMKVIKTSKNQTEEKCFIVHAFKYRRAVSHSG